MKRITNETEVEVEIGCNIGISTTIPVFDHLLEQLSKWGDFPLKVEATGDNYHHIVEDVGICLGRLLKPHKERVSHAIVPMDDALVMVCVDFSGRGHADIELPIGFLEQLDSHILIHFFETVAREGKFNLHIITFRGSNNHHIAEAAFKAFGKAISQSLRW
ncbi:unnamed protein product [marine sediment metagenome]|uniref:Imidazoleglycerol-phosphate dehydratase n=1 Tax=marine sediment metagenome TaxID=412755 RepID=X0YIA7_9ZZZZ